MKAGLFIKANSLKGRYVLRGGSPIADGPVGDYLPKGNGRRPRDERGPIRTSGLAATIEITAFACGDVAFVGVPCELFTDLGRDIKARSPFRHTIVVTLADGPIGYVGSRRAMSEGGYEMTSSPLAPGGGELIVDTAADVLASLAEPNPIS